MSVVCVGGHPDDPESGCGGTLARYSSAGHRVAIIYLTRGERGIAGKSLEEAAAIRTAEAQAACKILGAKPVFAGQIDGDTRVDKSEIARMQQLIAAEQADVVFTQWPIDTHPDHQAASVLTIRAYLSTKPAFPLYFFEVNSGYQTLNFNPDTYVDISPVRETKKSALFAHKSQDGAAIYREHHEIMENFRGRELGGRAAEAFVAMGRDTGKTIPGV